LASVFLKTESEYNNRRCSPTRKSSNKDLKHLSNQKHDYQITWGEKEDEEEKKTSIS